VTENWKKVSNRATRTGDAGGQGEKRQAGGGAEAGRLSAWNARGTQTGWLQ
jgi:hypothetical protein